MKGAVQWLNGSKQSERATAMSKLLPGTPQVPKEYQDLMGVFSEEECNTPPSHCPTDCATEFIPGAKLPKPNIYSMTPKEMRELREYIDMNLAQEFIQPAKSRVAAPILFKEKKDGSMRLFMDFREINAVCVENTYLLPLMKDLKPT